MRRRYSVGGKRRSRGRRYTIKRRFSIGGRRKSTSGDKKKSIWKRLTSKIPKRRTHFKLLKADPNW